MTAALSRLRAAARAVAADGTDPDRLAAVIAWSVQPGRHPDALRRRYRDLRDGGEPLFTEQSIVDHQPAEAVAQLAGHPDPGDADAAVEAFRSWRSTDVRVALVGDPAYPVRLAEGWPDLDAPSWLAVRGALPTAGSAVALVGARRASGYGTGVTAWLSEAASAAGVRIVSGGAVGIDAAAHEAALGRPGGTTVVLGCGHLVAYPRPHARPGGLFDRILDDGGAIVGESLPTDGPRAHRIRARNRIVAALVDVVVVVEGGPRSGSLLTATAAVERDRTVLAVPGDIRAAGSAAPHRLLSEGAAPCTSPRDLLDVVGRSPTATESAGAPPTSLPPDVYRVLAEAWPRPVRLEEVAVRSGHAAGALLARLTRAKVSGEVAESHDGLRLRRAPEA